MEYNYFLIFSLVDFAECEFDGSCTDDFTLTSEGKTIAWERINNFHNRILDKSKAGSGFMMADMRNVSIKSNSIHSR